MSKWYGSVQNRIAENCKMPQPEVGMAATILMYSDRHAATVVAVDGAIITVQQDKAIRVDKNGISESQEYVYERNEHAPLRYWRLEPSGLRREVEVNPKTGKYRLVENGAGLALGEREEYRDPCF